ncbi:hypothetical protein FRB99_002079 [Tulasnella sp. 403]|nr:hypothetical protein FRB99_002079 [Tulasnella sp. 403]
MPSLPPILYHVFKTPLPYRPTLALQHSIHQLQLRRRKESPASHPDVLLLLQHRPTYTGGRRQNAEDLSAEEARLKGLGADWVPTDRGGETTFHGPGQIVGYPLLDLGRMSMSIRTYICRLEQFMQRQVAAHGIRHIKSEHTGLFTSPTEKLGSIGVQVRHRLTTHGFAFNVTDEPLRWFDRVIACGLADVRATSILKSLPPTASKADVTVSAQMNKVVDGFSETIERPMRQLMEGGEDELVEHVLALERIAVAAGAWPKEPLASSSSSL